ncbi:hypothetical protein V2J09_022404 [Rumex salicifolius]
MAIHGRDILEINYPVGPFGTKEEPAVVKSVYDRRIVGCPGGEGEDEHDVVWFWLEKNKTHECPVCSQYFVVRGKQRTTSCCLPFSWKWSAKEGIHTAMDQKLEVVGQGGDPYGHGSEGMHNIRTHMRLRGLISYIFESDLSA